MADQPDTPESDDTDTPEEPTVDQPDPDEPDDEAFDAEKARDKIRKINSENRNLRQRATAAEAKAQEAEGKDEQLNKLNAENLRLRIAVKHGLPESLVKRLSGTTEEEILQDAEELMELFGSKKPPTQQPRERLRGGGDPTAPDESDVEKVVDRVFNN